MTFLDSSALVNWLLGREATIDAVERRGEPYLTSTICVYEVVSGKLGSGSTDVIAVRQSFDGVRSLDLTEMIALEAARIQDELLAEGVAMAPRDVMIAATARTTGDELITSDSDFDIGPLRDRMDITLVDEMM